MKLARRTHGGVSLDEHDRLVMEHFLQGTSRVQKIYYDGQPLEVLPDF